MKMNQYIQYYTELENVFKFCYPIQLKDKKEELIEDVLQILNVYTAKMNGMRKYKK